MQAIEKEESFMAAPLVWAHRGASGYAPENTLAAFGLAAQQGADGVELDIQFTRDRQIVVCHDEKIDRTSDHKGLVRDYTLEELKAMNFDNGNKAYEGEQIPTIEEVFDLLRPTDLTINIELKTGIIFYEGIEEAIVGAVHKAGFEKRVIYSSFNHATVVKLRKLDPEVPAGFLYMDGTLDMPEYAEKHGVPALHPALYNIQFPGFLEDCRARGIELNVWTVNEERYMKLCEKAGVHAIITNYPAKARALYGGR